MAEDRGMGEPWSILPTWVTLRYNLHFSVAFWREGIYITISYFLSLIINYLKIIIVIINLSFEFG